MCNPAALAASPAVEGAFFVGLNIITATVVPQIAGGNRAASGGTAIGRFAWLGGDGIARNTRVSVGDVRGLVVSDFPPLSDGRRVYYDDATATWRVREGLPVTVLSCGAVWVRFATRPVFGQIVYANTLDGSAQASYAVGTEATPWRVDVPGAAGDLSLISG